MSASVRPEDVIALCIGVSATCDARREGCIAPGLAAEPGNERAGIQGATAGALGVGLDEVTQRVLERFAAFEAAGGDLQLVERPTGAASAVGCGSVESGGLTGSVVGIVEHGLDDGSSKVAGKEEVAA